MSGIFFLPRSVAKLLIESLEEEPDEGLEAAWKAETESRLAQLESGQVRAVPWEEVKGRLLQTEHDS